MQEKITQLINKSLITLIKQGVLKEQEYTVIVSHSKNKTHGDYASNIALTTCSYAINKTNPRDMAALIIKNIIRDDDITNIEVAGAGFINFFVNSKTNNNVISDILTKGKDFGLAKVGVNKSILLEFVSANPTGPLHIGHGRGAAYGSSVANLLRAIGYEVECEYYVNDAGRQMDILTISVYLRYLERCGVDIAFPDNGYKGEYIYDIAQKIQDTCIIKKLDFSKLTANAGDGGDKDLYIDGIIANTKEALQGDYDVIFNISIDTILDTIKEDLAYFGVNFDNYFQEKNLISSKLLTQTIAKLTKNGSLYKQDGALWFRTTDFGDEKDRVVVRKNKQSTYFASDLAYHYEKLNRQVSINAVDTKNYTKIINIWGSDHHGYIPRVKAGIEALGHNSDKLEVLLVQFANLYRGKTKVPMSTRSGEFITLKSLIDEVGVDATRFFYILRRCEQHMDFDIELAKSQTNDNPVYYIQYAHARIAKVLMQIDGELDHNKADYNLLVAPQEYEIIKLLNRYNNVLLNAAKNYEPHQLAYYLRDLSAALHTYYASCEFLGTDKKLTLARLSLISAVKQVIKNALNLLGVDAPESM